MHEVNDPKPQRFSVTERLLLLPILQTFAPPGDIISVRIQADLEREIGFTEEEVATLQLRHEGEEVKWDPAADTGKAIQLGPIGQRLIVTALKQASAKQVLRPIHLPLWDRFVPVQEAAAQRGPVAVPGE